MGCAASTGRASTVASSFNSRRATAVAPEEQAAAAISERLHTEALDLAKQLFAVTKGRGVKDAYVR
jgi:hypothetical protein